MVNDHWAEVSVIDAVAAGVADVAGEAYGVGFAAAEVDGNCTSLDAVVGSFGCVEGETSSDAVGDKKTLMMC